MCIYCTCVCLCREMATTFARLCQQVDLTQKELEGEISRLSVKIQELETVQNRSKTLRSDTLSYTHTHTHTHTHTAGKISIEHVTIFLSKYISKGAIDMKFSPSNPYIQRNKNKHIQKLSYVS